ncbi:unnamed protein product [Gadus morhua 'NCC']
MPTCITKQGCVEDFQSKSHMPSVVHKQQYLGFYSINTFSNTWQCACRSTPMRDCHVTSTQVLRTSDWCVDERDCVCNLLAAGYR